MVIDKKFKGLVKEDLLEMFITYDLEDLYGDFSDDGDGKLELTEKGNEVATTLIKLVEQEIEKAKREAQIGVLTDIFQNCYQEDSKTLELVEEKLSKLTTK